MTHDIQINRRSALFRTIVGAASIGIVGVQPRSAEAYSQYGRYWPAYLMGGDVLVGRIYNRSQWWGYFRHAGVYNGQYVVEGGVGRRVARVHRRSLARFVRYYDEVRVLREKHNPNRNGPRIGYQADIQIGQNDYCGKMVRDAYNAALGANKRWVYPDNIVVSGAFTEVGFKRD